METIRESPDTKKPAEIDGNLPLDSEIDRQKRRAKSSIILGSRRNKELINDDRWLSKMTKFFSQHIIPNIKEIKKEKMRNTLWEYYEELHSKKFHQKANKKSKKAKDNKSNSKMTQNIGLIKYFFFY